MNKKTRSTKSEKWRHTCNSVEIAWTNEQKVAVTSYGRNKNHDDEIKKNQEKANNSPSYRCAAINQTSSLGMGSLWQNMSSQFLLVSELLQFFKIFWIFPAKIASKKLEKFLNRKILEA